MHIYVGPVEISGIYGKISEELKNYDLQVTFAPLYKNNFNFNRSDKEPSATRFAHWIINRHDRSNFVLKYFYKLLFLFFLVSHFTFALIKYDTYLFTWGLSLLPKNLDLPILKFFGKRVVSVIGHGSEARPVFMSFQNSFLDSDETAKKMVRKIKIQFDNLKRIQKYSDELIALPTTSQFINRRSINFYSLGIPTSINKEPLGLDNTSSAMIDKRVKIMHFPSNPGPKGTEIIESLLNQIKNFIPNIEFIQPGKLTNSEVLELMCTADLIIDQMWSDIPMAVVGTEAASLRVASVTFGEASEIWKSLEEKVPFPSDSYFPTADFIKVVEALILSESDRRKLAAAQQDFVTKNWEVNSVAGRYAKILKGIEFDESWYFNPSEFKYAWGAGLPKSMVLQQVSSVYKRYGWKSLMWQSAKEIYSEYLN